jgi:hypothetical protein
VSRVVALCSAIQRLGAYKDYDVTLESVSGLVVDLGDLYQRLAEHALQHATNQQELAI